MSRSSPLNIALHGATGRMGQTIGHICSRDARFQIRAETPKEGETLANFDLGDLSGKGIDVVVDFSHVAALPSIVESCVAAKLPLVSGTTGLDLQEKRLLNSAAKTIPVFWAPNMSPGISLCRYLAEQMASSLDETWDVEITDTHHAKKVDAPSGTALFLGEGVAQGRDRALADLAEFQRHGIDAERKSGAIGFSSIRGGDIVGEHSVIFFGQGERLEISHKMTHREGFAKGALKAATWLVGKPPGLYGMDNFLGL